MSTATTTAAARIRNESRVAAMLRARPRLWALLAVVVVWIVVWSVTEGMHTLEISTSTRTDVHGWLQDLSESVAEAFSAQSNAIARVVSGFADAMDSIFTWLQHLFTVAPYPRPLPQIGWLGTIAIAALVTFAIAGWRMVLLVVPSFFLFGFLGYWTDSVDTLLITLFSVLIACVAGIPLGVWMAHSKAVSAIVTPILDVMQTMPSFVYLLPFSILFGIGPAAAIMVTLVYATPPVIRISAHGLRTVNSGVLEATDSLGQGRLQRLVKVELPLAKRTIIVGVNQTIMAALAMATIAAYINGPGLGQPVIDGLKRGQFGTSFVAGLCIVIAAVMLDRTTTAASVRSEQARRAGDRGRRLRRMVLAAGTVGTLIAVYLSHVQVWANEFPANPDLGTPLRNAVDDFGDWLRTNLSSFTASIQNNFTEWFLNPVQSLVAESPWFVTAVAILLIAAIVGGVRALVATAVCLAGIYLLDLWYNAMVTLTSVLVATAIVVVIAVVLGVAMGRSIGVDRAVRPLLDAGQTIPPFVPLIPVLILFGPNRFTAIIAAVIYAVPIATKLVADGIRGVSPETLEASRSTGASRWQEITKVQLPMARGSLLLATNQGLLYVLSMVVIGGMVGAGGLGFDIVKGFRQSEYVGRGLAAGITIVLLGIMLDRITTYGAARAGASSTWQQKKPLLRRPAWAGLR
ncbi:ABC transporter permease [Nocardioides sp. Root1257]|uniref:ABC transporter permease n=1 Tax=unclassified Nocardioides TaxID=2615069 RepID=UPI0006FA6DF4|nr:MULTISPECIES: ABC transporter permease subunit [unclassified Nocardioides]KQW47516.1 ABC transporter permease [Nocardioides sp. Root1257]KRC45672.1 ABC transporter permease [Nocardioides sp. Root224]